MIDALYALSARATGKQSEVKRTMTDELLGGYVAWRTMTDQSCLVGGNFSKQILTQQAEAERLRLVSHPVQSYA